MEKAVKEINGKTELDVSYAPIRTGRGGKTTSVRFYLKRKVANVEVIESEESQRSEMVGKVREIIKDVKLTKKDCISILKASN